MDEIYEAPKSDVIDAQASGEVGFGSLAKALRGDYVLSFKAVLSEAWKITNGAKGLILGAIALVTIVQIGLNFAIGFFAVALGPAAVIVAQILATVISWVLSAGLMMVVVLHAGRRSVSALSVFDYFPKALSITGLMLLYTVLGLLGCLLFVLPGIYLAVGYWFAIPLLLDKKLSIWQALECSRKAVHHHWFKFFGLMLFAFLVCMFIGIVTLIGWIWLFPLAMLIFGVLYKVVFGLGVEDAPV